MTSLWNWWQEKRPRWPERQGSLLRFFVRLSAFVSKEIFEILRQTRLVVTLILGPFLILLLFGLGYRNQPRDLRTLFVVPEGSGLEDEVEQYSQLGKQIDLVGIIHDAEEANRMLRRQEVDLVVIAPGNPIAEIRESQQAILKLHHYEIDPIEQNYIDVVGRVYVNELNRRLLRSVAEQAKNEAETVQGIVHIAQENARTLRQVLQEGSSEEAQQYRDNLAEDVALLRLAVGSSLAVLSTIQEQFDVQSAEADSILQQVSDIEESLGTLGAIVSPQEDYTAEIETIAAIEADLARLDELLAQFREIDSYVLVSPFDSETSNVADIPLEPIDFYTPAVIALLLQHIAVTLAALSIIRERRAGTIELFRVSPISAFETLVGKYASFLLLAGVVTLFLTLLTVFVLEVPVVESWLNYALVTTAVTFASLGIGFIISLLARTDSQAVQYAMITLLASVFFSGFFMALYRLREPIRSVSWLLPATYGTTLLKDIMLRGQTADPALHLYLILMGLVLFLAAWLLLRRAMMSK